MGLDYNNIPPALTVEREEVRPHTLYDKQRIDKHPVKLLNYEFVDHPHYYSPGGLVPRHAPSRFLLRRNLTLPHSNHPSALQDCNSAPANVNP